MGTISANRKSKFPFPTATPGPGNVEPGTLNGWRRIPRGVYWLYISVKNANSSPDKLTSVIDPPPVTFVPRSCTLRMSETGASGSTTPAFAVTFHRPSHISNSMVSGKSRGRPEPCPYVTSPAAPAFDEPGMGIVMVSSSRRSRITLHRLPVVTAAAVKNAHDKMRRKNGKHNERARNRDRDEFILGDGILRNVLRQIRRHKIPNVTEQQRGYRNPENFHNSRALLGADKNENDNGTRSGPHA